MKNSVKSILIVVVLLLIASIFVYSLPKNPPNRLIAKIENYRIYESDVQDTLKRFYSDEKGEAKIEDLPYNFINSLVVEAVINKKIDKQTRKMHLEQRGDIRKNVSNYKKELIKETYLNEFVLSKISNDRIKTEYDKYVELLTGQKERKIKHILVSSEEEINRIKNSLKRGDSFEKLAKTKSIDKGSAENEGDIGYITKGELVPEFAEMAFLIKKDEISKPVKTQFGWHIIKVEDIRPATILPFEEVKDGIRMNLQNEEIKDYIRSISPNETKIKLFVNSNVEK
ncbi:MAG: peptidylprolyl isomerase [Rickettsiales bacterium]|jgi:peptidyl-prolyl cis-trans isomerase C|nr:peptidylprolyl isomerase [Rickettsiales bacterium]